MMLDVLDYLPDIFVNEEAELDFTVLLMEEDRAARAKREVQLSPAAKGRNDSPLEFVTAEAFVDTDIEELMAELHT